MAISMPVTVAQSSAAWAATSPSCPRILDYDFLPRELILDNASVQIAFYAHIADDSQDIESIEAVFTSPSQNQSVAAFMNSTDLLSGDARNGNYSTNLSFSPSSQVGTWTVEHLTVCDKAGDCRRINATAAEASGFPSKLQIIKNESAAYPQRSEERALDLNLDPNELRGWANTDKSFSAQRKIIINSVFNRPSICWP
ncbi:MAG: hypothetical protein PHN61_09610 [Methanothrix sp.]|nr:hypothetical protein [Methanothrix sp.]